MPKFDTPEPIAVTIELYVGDVRIVASDRTDTVVEVRPSNDNRPADIEVAEQTQVEYTGGRLLVKAPKPPLWKRVGSARDYGVIDIAIELPTGSQVQGDTGVGSIHTQGRLGDARLKSGAGNVQVDTTGALESSTGMGNLTVERAVGRVEVSTGSGEVRIRHIEGSAEIRNSNGDTRIDAITGELRVKAANGDITVGTAESAVTTKTANGAIRIGEIVRGSVVMETALGELEIGVRQGTAALLDLRTQFGAVHNALDAAEGPEPSGETAEVRAHTSAGDIIVRRSA